MTIIKFDSIVEISFVIQAWMRVPPKGGDITLVMEHARSPPTQIILSEGFMYILRSHCLHLCIPLTLLTKCSCTIPVCYSVYIVELRAVRDPPPFSAQKCIFLFVLMFVHSSFFSCISWQMQWNADLPWSLRVCAACVFVCVCEAWLSVLVGWTGKRPSRWARLLLPACWRSCTCLLESALSRSPHAGLPSPVFT